MRYSAQRVPEPDPLLGIFCTTRPGVILVNMEISVILGHEKTKIQNIIDYGKIDVFSVRTNIHIKNKMMGHLI